MSRQYYILDTRQVVGNCALFWRANIEGYTCDLGDAGRYEEADAFRKRAMRSTDVPLAVEDVERLVVRHVRLDTAAFQGLLSDMKTRKAPTEGGL